MNKTLTLNLDQVEENWSSVRMVSPQATQTFILLHYNKQDTLEASPPDPKARRVERDLKKC